MKGDEVVTTGRANTGFRGVTADVLPVCCRIQNPETGKEKIAKRVSFWIVQEGPMHKMTKPRTQPRATSSSMRAHETARTQRMLKHVVEMAATCVVEESIDPQKWTDCFECLAARRGANAGKKRKSQVTN